MASTRGFVVSNMPQAASVDPRLLAFSPQVITQGLEQGARAYGNLMQIQQAREEAPIRRQMLQLQQENAMLNNARLAQPISRIIGSSLSEVPRYQPQETIVDDGRVITETPAGYDLVLMDTISDYDPRTKKTTARQVQNKVIRTMEDIEKDQSLINWRDRPRSTSTNATALERNMAAYQAALESGDTETANLYLQNIQKSPKLTKAQDIAAAWGEIARLEDLGDPQSLAIAESIKFSLPQERNTPYTSLGARAGFTQEVASALSQIPAGAALLAKASGQITNFGQFKPSPEDLALIQSVEQQLSAPPPAPPAPRQAGQFQIPEVEVVETIPMPSFLGGATTPAPAVSAGSTPEFANAADAEAAGASGQLGNKRVRIKIGNRYAWWEPNN